MDKEFFVYIGKLLYYEIFNNPNDAIEREKQIKKWGKRKKKKLINSINPGWEDLYEKQKKRGLALTHFPTRKLE